MRLSPYDPPGVLAFGLMGLSFLMALYLLPKLFSQSVAAFGVTALSILPTAISSIWVYWWFHHSMSSGGFSGGGDPREIMANIFNTSLFSIAMSAVMLLASGFFAYRLQKKRQV